MQEHSISFYARRDLKNQFLKILFNKNFQLYIWAK